MRHYLLSCLLVLSADVLSAQFRTVFKVDKTSPIAEAPVTLKGQRTPHKIELRNFNPDAKPFLYLLMRGSSQVGSAAAVGSDLSLSVDGKTAGDFTVLVRAGYDSPDQIHRGDIWVNGELVAPKVQFSSGTIIMMPRLAPMERVIGVRMPGGPQSHAVFIFSPDGLQLRNRSEGLNPNAAQSTFEDAVVVAARINNDESGPVIIIRNNPDNDTDGDGLSNPVEAEIGTCMANSGTAGTVNCGQIPDPRDTDGDALMDGWEVLGKTVTWVENGVSFREHLPLPSWGSNPRHKDIFLEVDFRRETLQDNQTGKTIKMLPEVAKAMADAYADKATTDPGLRIAHAASVRNPDGSPGISLHLDIGLQPTDAADRTVYGDWGGFTPVNAVQDTQGNWVPQNPANAWMTQMSRARHGVFHYVLGYPTGGGQAHFGSIAVAFNFHNTHNSAHEFGHTLNLDHDGSPGTAEPNCKPNYPSLMNYAFGNRLQFADGLNVPSLNNHQLTESSAVNPSQTVFLDVLEQTFQYKVDRNNGSVDWNRDGSFATPGTFVRAYANYRPGASCEYTRQGQKPTGLTSEKAAAVVYAQNRLFVFSIGTDSRLYYANAVGNWICSPSVDHCPEPVFETPAPLGLGSLASMDARYYRKNATQEYIIITGILTNGSIIERAVLMANGWPAWATDTTIAGPGSATGEITLAVSEDNTKLSMVYKGPDHTVRYRHLTTTGWSGEVRLTAAGQPIKMHPNTSPGLAYTRLPVGMTVQENLVGVFTDEYGFLQFYTPGFGLGWTRIPLEYETIYAPNGRPVLAWIGKPPTNTDGGGSSLITASRLYVIYVAPPQPSSSATPTTPIRMAMSYVGSDGKLKIGLDSYFDNYWAYGYGMNVLQPSTTKLRTVMTSAVPTSLRQVMFRPNSDGISDLTYSNFDDWKVLGWSTCKTLSNVQSAPVVQCGAQW